MSDDYMTALHKRMGGGRPFTYLDLCAIPGGDAGCRIADREIQRWRRKGLITFSRVRGRPIWRLTPEGVRHVYLKSQEPPHEHAE